MTFDFPESHRDEKKFLGCEPAFQVVDNSCYSIDNMTDEELRESIIEDLLAVTMWEKQSNQKIHFGFQRFMRFLPIRPISKRERVFAQMHHADIVHLIDHKDDENDGELRIKDNHAILQAAMDYAGVWYSDFVMPDGAVCIDRQAIEDAGGIETIATSLYMDVISQQTPSTTKH